MIYCRVENGVVTNRAVFEGEMPEGWDAEGETWVQSDDAQIGWTYIGGVFEPPAAPPAAAPTLADYQRAIQLHVDATAGQKGYDTGASCAGYASSSVAAWASEATAFIAWRDAVWLYVYAQLAAVEAQQRTQPTPAELVAELPAMTWPT